MQFEQLPGGERHALPRPSIDTGMGLERIAAVLQGKHDNYDIDLFRALIRAIAEMSKVLPEGAQNGRAPGHRRPSARGGVSDRRRRAAVERGPRLRAAPHHAPRHAPRRPVGRARAADPEARAGAGPRHGPGHPELVRAEAPINETLKLEETRFRNTLERGLSILDDETKTARGGDNLRGDTAFTLYDTYGFPLDLTQDALRNRGIGVDLEAFNEAMENQRETARAYGPAPATLLLRRRGFLPPMAWRYRISRLCQTETAEGAVAALIRD